MNNPAYLLAFATVAALTAAACNVSTDGANGNVTFTPTNCGGGIICDFDSSIGVGGKVDLNIAGLEGISTAGTNVVSDSPNILSAISVPDVGGQPTWELESLAAGVATLSVVTTNNETLDFIEVPMQDLTGLITQNILGNAVGPTASGGFDQVWTVNANEDVTFQVTPVIGLDVPTMGRYVYTATVDIGIEDGLLQADLSEGYLSFNVPAGQYSASFEDDFGHIINLQFDAQ